MIIKEANNTRIFIGRLGFAKDVIEEFIRLSKENDIQAAWLQGIGALTMASVTEYDPFAAAYKEPIVFNKTIEIISLKGNISILDGEPFVHIHLHGSYFGDDNKIELVSGHLVKSEIFATEFKIEVFDDVELTRSFDSETGLNLWK
ncbi:MAG: DUF296 domain-containing protein [Pseudomonadota bacterium]